MRCAMSAGGAWISAVEREHAVLVRQREVVGRDEHRRVLAQRGEQPVHRDQRAQRVAVGVLVRREHKARVLAQALDHELAGRRRGLVAAHEPSISSIRALTRSARSVVSS